MRSVTYCAEVRPITNTLLPALLERLPFPVLRTGAQAGAVLGARLGGAGANFFVVLILTRSLGPMDVGIVLTAFAAAVLGEVAATLGRDAVAVQAIPQALARDDRAAASAFARSLGRQVFWGAPIAGGIAGAAVLILTGGEASLRAAALTAMIVVAMTALRAVSRVSMAAGGVARGALILLAIRPLILLGIVFALSAKAALTAEAALAAAGIAAFLATGVQVAVSARLLRFVAARPTPADPAWGASGRQLILPSLMIGELPNLVTLLAAVILDEAAIAILGVTLRIAGLVALGSRSLIAALSPRLSASWSEHGAKAAQRMGRAVPMIGAPATAIVVALVWVFAETILGIFGPGYAQGAWALRVLVLMPLVSACAGPSLLVLTAAGRADEGGKAAWSAVGVLAALTVVGALGGPLGVCAGVVAAILYWEVQLIVRLWRATAVSLWLPFFRRA